MDNILVDHLYSDEDQLVADIKSGKRTMNGKAVHPHDGPITLSQDHVSFKIFMQTETNPNNQA